MINRGMKMNKLERENEILRKTLFETVREYTCASNYNKWQGQDYRDNELVNDECEERIRSILEEEEEEDDYIPTFKIPRHP
jgi:hypothetical protein